MAKSFDPLKNPHKIRKKSSLSHVNAERNVCDFTMLLVAEIDKGREESRRQIINTELPGILECLQRIGLPRS